MKTSLLPPKLKVIKEEENDYSKELEDRNYVCEKYKSFYDMYEVWNEDQPILGFRTPKQFWEDSERDFAVLTAEAEDENDPVEQYQTTISRDKTQATFAFMAGKLLRPSALAQNNDQQIDHVMGRVGDAVIDWAFRNDGWPSKTGQQKNTEVIHTAAVTGTSYTLDVVTKDGLESEKIPNEECFYPNLWQNDLQQQSKFYRAKLNITYQEAEEDFGMLDKWDDVPEHSGWAGEFTMLYPELKPLFGGIIEEDKVSILYTWERATQKQLVELKKKKKVYQKAKRAWYYNVIINGVAMFPKDNVSPYKHGILPISKLVLEYFAKSEFALGNSIPNKCAEDKKWKDAWKTNIRYRGKLAGMPPQLVFGGYIDGEEAMRVATFTSVPANVTKVEAVPGIVAPSQADAMLMNMADSEIDRSTMSPSATGQQGATQTARAEVIQAANATAMMEPLMQQLAFWNQSRSMHILLASLQMIQKKDIKRIAVPDQTLDDGLTGSFEVIFKEPKDALTEEIDADEFKMKLSDLQSSGVEVDPNQLKQLMHSMGIAKAEDKSRRSGKPMDRLYCSPSVLQDMKFYLYSDATNGMIDKSAMKQEQMTRLWPLLSIRQGIDQNELNREVVKIFDLSERILSKEQAPVQALPPGMPQGSPQGSPQGQIPSAGDLQANAMSKQVTGQGMPALR